MNKPLITVITAAWHVDGMPKVLESLKNQTYQNFHHIIINDNNPEIREWLKENNFFDEDPRTFVIDSHVRTHYYGGLVRNMGVIASFSYLHASLRDIENEWVCFHDDDNTWTPDHLESMVETLNVAPFASMIAADMVMLGAVDKTFREERKCEIKHCHCDLGSFLYKTRLFREHGYFFPHPHRKHKFDWELIEKFAKAEEGKIAFTNKPTFLMNYKKK